VAIIGTNRTSADEGVLFVRKGQSGQPAKRTNYCWALELEIDTDN